MPGLNSMPLILLVEDEPAVAKIVEFKVKRSGYEFEHRMDGLEGLNAALELQPDVVILDVMLPSMNGFEILRKIREDDKGKDLKVILLTSKHRVEDLKLGFTLKVDEYMEKPFMPDELMMRLTKLLG